MNLGCCSRNWKNGRAETKYLWDSTTDEFLDLPGHILEFMTTENYNKSAISVVGRSGCGLGINVKRVGAGTNVVKNSGYFPACHVAVMLTIETKPGGTRTKSCSSARETKKKKKVTSKQEQRLNFSVNVDFWFCNDDFCKKPEGNKT